VSSPLWKRCALALAIAAPALSTLFLVIYSGRIPHHDYWGIQQKFFSASGFSAEPRDWFIATRAHFMPLTYLLYAANIVATKGSNLGLSGMTWMFAGIQTALLVKLARAGGLGGWWPAAIAAFCFTLCAAEPWLMGFSGVPNVGSQTLSIASIYCLGQPRMSRASAQTALGLGLALLAGFTFSTGLPACLIAILALVWGGAKRRWILAAVVSAALLFALRSTMVAAFYAPRPAPSIRIPDPTAAAHYGLALMGGIFSQTIEIGSALAFMGIAAAGYAGWQARKDPRARPWILLLLLSLAQAGLITLGRWDQGPLQAIASRYSPIPALFWLATFVLLALLAHHRASRAVLAILVVAAVVAMSTVGWGYNRSLLYRASLQSGARLSVRYKVPDAELIQLTVTPWTSGFLSSQRALSVHGLVPFDRPLEAEWGSMRADLLHAPPDRQGGATLALHRFRERGLRMMLQLPDHTGSILLVNEHGVIRGAAEPLVFAPYEQVVWLGYARVEPKDQLIRVVRIPDVAEADRPVQLAAYPLAALPVDGRGLQVFKRVRELPREHHAGRRLFPPRFSARD